MELLMLNPLYLVVRGVVVVRSVVVHDANSGDVLRDKIITPSCEVVTIGGEGYDASAGNGATAGAVSPAWDTRIGYDPDARWNDVTNTVDGSTAGADWRTITSRGAACSVGRDQLVGQTRVTTSLPDGLTAPQRGRQECLPHTD
jgi:hypothetical protein